MSNFIIETYTPKTNKVDLVDSAHINAVQTSIVTIEDALNILISQNGSLAQGTSFPTSPAPVEGQIFWRTDLHAAFVYSVVVGAWQALGGSLSSTLFQYVAVLDRSTISGEVTNTAVAPTSPTLNYRYLAAVLSSSGLVPVWHTKWKKISGVNTVTVYAQIWHISTGGSGSNSAQLQVDIGGQNNTVTGTVNQHTPEWVSFTIDVSGLTTGTVYDVTASLSFTSLINNWNVFLGNLIAFGS